ncbi:MAG: GTPase Era [Bacteroidales bacterium]|jgi:GTP-binding protein Era|nr:GTPase Era [Bacteroidales bacterium]
MTHKSGFVNIIGNPNVGKSTLMNALVGEKLSIITYKAQTTRHRIMGIVNGEDFQIIYSDNPGIVNPHYKLHQQMMNFVSNSLSDADIFLLVTEVGESLKNEEILDKIINSKVPVILVINKIDLASQEQIQEKIDYWQKIIPRAEIIPTCAIEKFNIDKIFDTIISLLPNNPPYFPKDELTDKSMRFFASEIIREKILLLYKKEIPYSVEVRIEKYKEGNDLDSISAVIYVERESQKGIIIGLGGKMIKQVGIQARKDIEDFTSKRCYLELFVKVRENWRNNDNDLKQFGYETK